MDLSSFDSEIESEVGRIVRNMQALKVYAKLSGWFKSDAS
jgi:hypothetical protein